MTRKSIGMSFVAALISGAACGGGMESQACKDYFAAVETCAAKAPAPKGDILRKMAATSKEGFAKNSNPMAVSESCKAMLTSLQADPDCK
ncbi:hypothetical protein [Nannocystis bainbridge]|uniref:Lipoprotein n=1 Tax=Nannocystis bainbridge TaxID=2995303 RepID=A0ABT5DRI7_9BACT|nr:hypothetical protein [Nannocystis bainbridge]MDC0716260.1 hypothetical protein [Nannocystis bainbridge]